MLAGRYSVVQKLLHRSSGWSLAESPDPVPGPGDAVVRITRALVEPITAQSNSKDATEITPGREFVGVVLASPASPALIGKRVIASASLPCSACDLCRAGLSIHCRSRSEIGTARDGALADKILLPTWSLLEVPRSLDDDRACFTVPLARALHAADLVKLESKPYVTILGDDALALLSAQVMTHRNASVRVLGREPSRFGLCEKWGVKHRHVDDVGRRADQDVVFVCSSSPGDLEVALRLARPRATVLLLASPGSERTPERSAMSLLHTGEISLIGSRGERLAEALRLLASDSVDVRSLLTAKFRFAQFEEAFARAARPDSLRVLLEAA